MRLPPRLAIVLPCYNEQEVLETTIPRILACLRKLITDKQCRTDSYILFIDDGSFDNSWQMISDAASEHPGKTLGLKLATNVGHQYALLAGLHYVKGKCDAAITMDADLQDDLDVITQMITKYRNGAEIVLGVKRKRNVDSWFKRSSAQAFYKLLQIMRFTHTMNHADFRLMSAKTLTYLGEFSEVNLFLRGLLPLLHHKQAIVHYDIHARTAGVSKYSLGKMLTLAWNGITSSTILPLRFITALGVIIFLFSSMMIVYGLFAFSQAKHKFRAGPLRLSHFMRLAVC